MRRDSRVIFYGEDVADYGGAFKMTKGLIETFGRDRVFNTPISEAAICGTAVGAGIAGLRPVVELMYMDFALMSSDQIANQAAKWHYMSGGQVEVPVVIRCSVGAGKGYGGQHSQSLESLFTHIPGLWVVYPATAEDAKGLLKSAIRTNNPVVFVESQGLYSTKGVVPEGDYTTPIGKAKVVRAGTDATIVAWGPAVPDALAAADILAVSTRDPGRGDRPAEPRAAGHGDGPRVRAQDRPRRGRRAGGAERQLRQRDRGPHPGRGVRRPRRPGRPDRRRERHQPPGREPREGIPAQHRRHRRRRCGPDLTTARTASNAEGTRPMAHPILMPKPGQMTEECVLTLWRKEVGEPVHRGDVLFEIETDKSSMEVETFDEGVLLAKLVQDGETAPVNAVCGWIGQAGEAVPEAPAAPAAAAAAAPAEAAAGAPGRREPAPEPVPPGPADAPLPTSRPRPPRWPTAASSAPGGKIRISPRASRLAAQAGIDPLTVTGTGPDGRIVERDIAAAVDARSAAPAPVAAPAPRPPSRRPRPPLPPHPSPRWPSHPSRARSRRGR